MMFCSGVLLLYTAIVAPVQIFLWEFDEEVCNTFPTLYFDLFVDIFFLVRPPQGVFPDFRDELVLSLTTRSKPL
jgi:hypothetical protein